MQAPKIKEDLKNAMCANNSKHMTQTGTSALNVDSMKKKIAIVVAKNYGVKMLESALMKNVHQTFKLKMIRTEDVSNATTAMK